MSPTIPQGPQAPLIPQEELHPPPYSSSSPSAPPEAPKAILSPPHTRSGTLYPTTPPSTSALFPLREVAGAEGTVRVQVPFSIIDIQQCKEKLGKYSENPDNFADGFQILTLAYDLSWRDVQFILATCCTGIERDRILEAARREADEAFARNPQGNAPGPDNSTFC